MIDADGCYQSQLIRFVYIMAWSYLMSATLLDDLIFPSVCKQQDCWGQSSQGFNVHEPTWNVEKVSVPWCYVKPAVVAQQAALTFRMEDHTNALSEKHINVKQCGIFKITISQGFICKQN